MIDELRRLWTGELPLARAFWGYAVVGGLAVNLVTSLLFIYLLVLDRPVSAVLAGYGASVPFNLLVLVGVWRAAGRHPGERAHADLARVVTLAGMAILSLT